MADNPTEKFLHLAQQYGISMGAVGAIAFVLDIAEGALGGCYPPPSVTGAMSGFVKSAEHAAKGYLEAVDEHGREQATESLRVMLRKAKAESAELLPQIRAAWAAVR